MTSKEQTGWSMTEQGVRAIIEAVSATEHGRLLAVVLPWDVDMSKMTWTPRVLRLTRDLI